METGNRIISVKLRCNENFSFPFVNETRDCFIDYSSPSAIVKHLKTFYQTEVYK